MILVRGIFHGDKKEAADRESAQMHILISENFTLIQKQANKLHFISGVRCVFSASFTDEQAAENAAKKIFTGRSKGWATINVTEYQA